MLSIFLFVSLAMSDTTVEHEQKHVLENQILLIHDLPTLDSYSKYENIENKNNVITLRSKNGNGSVLNIKEEVTTDNWSVEFQVKNLMMNDVEKAGIYLWYNNIDVSQGTYKNGNPTFNGFLTGIEFSKDRADIVFSFNYGLDFTKRELQTMRFDHINPSLIDHLDFFNVKVIHTEKNFKVELYDQKNELISDSFRIHEPLIMNKGEARKHFAITTNYEHCPDDVFFELTNLQINQRTETEEYDYNHLVTEHNQYPRNKSDEELRLAIADIAHFMNYLTITLGSKSNNKIIEMAMSAKNKLRLVQSSIDTLTKEADKTSFKRQEAQEESLKDKIKDIEKSITNNVQKMQIMKEKLRLTKKNSGLDLKGILLCVSLSGLLFAIVWEAKGVLNQFISKSKIGKKE